LTAPPDEVIRTLVEGRVAAVTVTCRRAGFRADVRPPRGGRAGSSRRYRRSGETPAGSGPGSDADSLEGYFPGHVLFPADADEERWSALCRRFRSVAARLAGAAEGLARRQALCSLLVEKETGAAEERPWSLRSWPTASAGACPAVRPTVIFAEWLARGEWDGEINQSDLRRDSPYNTYRRKGLPPGPICNPGLPAIRAALQPAETGYLYFVSRNDGHHIFSGDLRAHNRAVRKYQRGS
jgi:UPF0755 protein